MIPFRFLGTVDKLGTAYEDKILSFGFGTHITVPLLRQERERNPNMSKEEAIAVIKKCMDMLYMRDARAGAKVCGSSTYYVISTYYCTVYCYSCLTFMIEGILKYKVYTRSVKILLSDIHISWGCWQCRKLVNVKTTCRR